jgi:hypothetical protein
MSSKCFGKGLEGQNLFKYKMIPSMKDLEKICYIKAPPYTQIKGFLGKFQKFI